MSAEPILHIAPAGHWEEARLDGIYRGDTLGTEGFIHCSGPDQVLRVAQARFSGRTDLVLLFIDPSRVTAPIRYEAAETEEQFPHLYGPLNLEAVVRVATFVPDAAGRFQLPAAQGLPATLTHRPLPQGEGPQMKDPEEVARRKAEERDFWDRAAGAWQRWWRDFEAESQPVSERLVDLAELRPGQRVLDVATGSGEPAATAARRVAPGGQVLGIDLAPAMIDLARARAAELGLANLAFQVMDAESPELPEASFDAILCRWGLMFFPDLPAALQRLYRLLRPGGRLATAVWAGPEQVPLLALPGPAIRHSLGLPPAAAPTDAFNLADTARFQALLAEHGFRDLRQEPVTVVCEYASPEGYAESRRELSGSAGDLLADRSPEERERAWQAVAAAAAPFRLPDGRVRLENQAICVSARR